MKTLILGIILAVIAAIALVTGSMGTLSGVAEIVPDEAIAGSPALVVFDSNLRYLSGMWLGIGLVLLAAAFFPAWRRPVLAVLAVPVFLGGLSRAFSMLWFGPPDALFVLFMFLELIFPLLVLLERRLLGSEHSPDLP